METFVHIRGSSRRSTMVRHEESLLAASGESLLLELSCVVIETVNNGEAREILIGCKRKVTTDRNIRAHPWVIETVSDGDV